MQHQQDRLFPHHRAVRNQLRAFDVEEQPHPVHGYVHERISIDFVNGPPGPAACLEADTKPYRNSANRIGNASHSSGALPISIVFCFRLTRDFVVRAKCHPDFSFATGAAAIAVTLAFSVQTSSAQITFPWERSPQGAPQGQVQSDDADLEMRIQRLENQLRQLTGQNEELDSATASLRIGCASSAPRRRRQAASRRRRSPAWPRRRPRFSPARRRGSRDIRNRVIDSSRAIRRPSPAMTSSHRRSPARADRTGSGSPAGGRPPPRRRLRPEPEFQRSGRAARTRRWRDADLERSFRPARRAGAVRANRSISAVRAIPVAPCRRPLQPHRHRAAPGPAPAPR